MVRWFESNDEIVAQIPVFIDDGTKTKAVILAVEYNNKLKFRLIVRDKFEKYKKNKKPKPTVEKIKDLFIIFDFQKYGESSYLYEGQIVSEYDSSTHLKSTSEWGEACYLIQAVFVNGELIDARWDCETYYIWDVEMTDPDEGGGDTSIWYEESAGTPSLPPVVIIDTTFSNTVANCVKIKLENGNILNNLLAGFNLDASSLNVTFKVDNLTHDNGICRYNPNTSRIEIIIDTDRLDASSMELANTILHESFHAYIYGRLYDPETHTGSFPEPNFKDDFEAYRLKYEGAAAHNYMANQYITYMKQGLEDYFSGESYESNFLNYVDSMSQWHGIDMLMECLAWSGLKATDAWTNFYSNPTNKMKYDETLTYIIPLLTSENCNN